MNNMIDEVNFFIVDCIMLGILIALYMRLFFLKCKVEEQDDQFESLDYRLDSQSRRIVQCHERISNLNCMGDEHEL